MPGPSSELAVARSHLENFERQMPGEDAFEHLTEALALLADIRDASDDARSAEIASNLASTYAKKALAKLQSLLAAEHTIHYEVFNDWWDIFAEFQGAGFARPPETLDVLTRLADKAMSGKLSQSEQKEIRERLSAVTPPAA